MRITLLNRCNWNHCRNGTGLLDCRVIIRIGFLFSFVANLTFIIRALLISPFGHIDICFLIIALNARKSGHPRLLILRGRKNTIYSTFTYITNPIIMKRDCIFTTLDPFILITILLQVL